MTNFATVQGIMRLFFKLNNTASVLYDGERPMNPLFQLGQCLLATCHSIIPLDTTHQLKSRDQAIEQDHLLHLKMLKDLLLEDSGVPTARKKERQIVQEASERRIMLPLQMKQKAGFGK